MLRMFVVWRASGRDSMGEPDMPAAFLALLPSNALQAWNSQQLTSCLCHPALKNNMTASGKKPMFGNARSLTILIQCTADARVCCTCTLMWPRTSGKIATRTLRLALTVDCELSTRCTICPVRAFSWSSRSSFPPNPQREAKICNQLCTSHTATRSKSKDRDDFCQ